MTTITVVKKGREVAIAADCQSTFGDTRLTATHDARSNKIFELDGSFFAISASVVLFENPLPDHEVFFMMIRAGMLCIVSPGRSQSLSSFPYSRLKPAALISCNCLSVVWALVETRQ